MAFLTGKKKQPKYRGFKVPVPLSMLLALRDELHFEQAGRHAFTCNMLGRIATRQTFKQGIDYLNDGHAEVYKDTKQAWSGFLEDLGIYTGGSGFDAGSWAEVGRPAFLAAMYDSDMSPNGLRLAFINDILKRAFKHG